MIVKRPVLVLSCLCVLAGIFFSVASAADTKSEEAARRAAADWLALVDQGKHGESWDQAAPLFKQAITRDRWSETLRSVRSPLGRLRSRQVLSSQYTETLPAAPDGEYVVIQYEASYENKKKAIETVTPMKDAHGVWRVSGYYIR